MKELTTEHSEPRTYVVCALGGSCLLQHREAAGLTPSPSRAGQGWGWGELVAQRLNNPTPLGLGGKTIGVLRNYGIYAIKEPEFPASEEYAEIPVIWGDIQICIITCWLI
jgi:hypothetical protein